MKQTKVFAVIAHEKELKCDYLKSIHQTIEGAESKIAEHKAEYAKKMGVDDFDTHYSLRIEEFELGK